ncbi:MAG: dihydrofolate reductase family protein [Actinocrinis sp.]
MTTPTPTPTPTPTASHTPRLRVHNLAMSVDGYVAGPGQSIDDPIGAGGPKLHGWIFETRFGRRMIGEEGGTTGVDEQFLVRGVQGIGATIMGRNMFGPVRGPWSNEGDTPWTGWWGPNPPFHHPVFVLTHHAHDPIPMDGGTTFHFVTDGIESALTQAREAADTSDIRLGGGASAVRQYLRAGLVDELHVAIVPVLLGGGERLFDNLDGGPTGFECVEFTSSPVVTHARFLRQPV